eukprot:TRINITY_DN3708_c2_g1_i1.p1 TRINITY_DN3708_c2_g1~~TRINITY_DN3708_c2_g1_i1.p1  ORF type:complete len:709 (-),score=91.47 TRINITY_DN3708_c2_g1_i1:580-2481(-)
MDARGNNGATGFMNLGNPILNGPVGVQTPRQVSPFNGVSTSTLLASQGTTAQQLQLQQQLRNLEVQRQQLIQQQQQQQQQRNVGISRSGGLPNVTLPQLQVRPQMALQMGQDQLLSQRLQQQAAQAALARGRASPQHLLGRASGAMAQNQLGNLTARSASGASTSSIDNIVRLLSTQQQNGVNGMGAQAPSSNIQSLLGRRGVNAPAINPQVLQTLAAARNNPVLTNALQNNLSNLNGLNNNIIRPASGGLANPVGIANQLGQANINASASNAGKQALLQQVLAAVQAQVSQNAGQGRVVPGGGSQVGTSQSAQELLVQLGVCFARLGISIEAAANAGLLGGLGAPDICLLADAHASEKRRLSQSVDLNSQLSGLGLSSVNSMSSDLSAGANSQPSAGGVSSVPTNVGGQKLSIMQMAASMDLGGKKEDNSPQSTEAGGSAMAQLLKQTNFAAPEYQNVLDEKEANKEGEEAVTEAENVFRAQSEILLADAKFDSSSYAFFGQMDGEGEELGGLEDDALEGVPPVKIQEDQEEAVVEKEDDVLDLVFPDPVPARNPEATPRNQDKVIQFGPKPSVLQVSVTTKIETPQDDPDNSLDNDTEQSNEKEPNAKKTNLTIADEGFYEQFQDIGIGFQ